MWCIVGDEQDYDYDAPLRDDARACVDDFLRRIGEEMERGE